MHNTRAINKISTNELKAGVSEGASWHQDYASSSYVFIANLNYEMNEGDIAIVFSQYGEPVDVHLVRHKKTGKSRGFCFLAYEDQRSTTLAVDNLNAADVCGRTLRVDHVKEFKPPKEYLELKDDDPDFFNKLYKPSGPDGKGWGQFREQTDEEKLFAQKQEALKKEKEQQNEKILDNLNELQNNKDILDADLRWDKMLMDEVENEWERKQKELEKLQALNARLLKKDQGPKKKVQVQETNKEREERLQREKGQKKKIKKHK